MDSIHFAADWFFDLVEFGIVIEDDLIINPPALEEAERLWEIVNKTEHLTVFSLGNPLPVYISNEIRNSYWSSNFFVSYAWCTSRETWNQSARSIADLNLGKINEFMKTHYGSFVAWNFRRFMSLELIRESNQRKKCSFAWRFTLDQISKGNFSIISTKNRIGYTGFGLESTNTNGIQIRGSDFGKRVDLETTAWAQPYILKPNIRMDYYFLREFGFIRTIQSTLAIRTRFKGIFKSLQ
jgi:hypothetical protein